MDLVTLAGAAGALALASALQTAVGFGIGLVAVPLLLHLGLPLPHAVAMLLGASTIQSSWGVWQARAHVHLGSALVLSVPQWLTLPVGVAGMAFLDGAGPTVVKRAVGVVILVMLVLRAVVRPTPRHRVPWPWAVLAGVSGGLLAGLVGMGGPPVVLYALAHDWPKDRFRAFLWTQLLLGVPALIAVMAWRFGPGVGVPFGTGLLCAPAIWLGGVLGLRLTAGWDGATMQRAATFVLLAIALVGIAGM